MAEKSKSGVKVSFEEALNHAGFGVYSYLLVFLSGLVIVAFACLAFNSAFIVPTSACELATTGGQQGLMAAGQIVGIMLGGTPWGYVGDTRGRRTALILSQILAASTNLIAALSVNWVMLLIMQFLVNVLAAGQWTMVLTLLGECVPMAKRNLSVLLVTSIYIFAMGVMAVIAMPIIPLSFSLYISGLGIYWNSWRTLLVAYSVPSILTAICLYFLTESPKYYYARGEEEKALEVLKIIHKRNNIWKPNEEYQVIGFLKEDKIEADNTLSAKDQIVPLFESPLLKYTIIMSLLFVFEQVGSLLIWFPTVVNQFMRMMDSGESLNQTLCSVLRSSLSAPPDPNVVPCSLNNTAMLIVLALSGVQSVVNILVSLVVNQAGRRNFVIGIAALCGFSGILVNLVANSYAGIALFVVLLIGYIVNGLYMAIAVAIFPTRLRALALALTMSFGRLGNIASIQLLNFLLTNNCDAGFYIFSSLFAASAVAAAFLPDDRVLAKKALEEKEEKEEGSSSS